MKVAGTDVREIDLTWLRQNIGLVTQEPYESIKLTEEGSRVAAMVLERHTILKAFLLKLGVGEANAEKDACLMEHILSAETMERVREFLNGRAGRAAKEKTVKSNGDKK